MYKYLICTNTSYVKTNIFEFVPLAMDTFGGWHKVALQTLIKLGQQLARMVGRDKDNTICHFRQILVRDNMQGHRVYWECCGGVIEVFCHPCSDL
jgi:hypothetical protein